MKVLRRLGLEDRLRDLPLRRGRTSTATGTAAGSPTTCPCPRSASAHRTCACTAPSCTRRWPSRCRPRRVHLGKRLVGLEPRGDGVTLAFEDGTRAHADAVIGADGVHSLVREILLGPDRPIHRGRVAYRAVFPAALLNGPISARRAPSGGGRIATSSSTTRRGRATRSTSSPACPSRVDWLTRRIVVGQGRCRRELRSAYEGFHADVRAVLAACPDCHKWAILEREPLPTLERRAGRAHGRRVSSDDAIYGPGRREAIEDAVVLARCLAELDEFETAFQRFEAHRKPRTSRIQAISSANTWLRQQRAGHELAVRLRRLGGGPRSQRPRRPPSAPFWGLLPWRCATRGGGAHEGFGQVRLARQVDVQVARQ